MNKADIIARFGSVEAFAKKTGYTGAAVYVALAKGKFSRRLRAAYAEACGEPLPIIRMLRTDRRCGVRKEAPDPREVEMLDMFRGGKNMQVIAKHFGISRERVRQLLKKFFDVTGKESPVLIANTIAMARRGIESRHRRMSRFNPVFGCTLLEWSAITGNEAITFESSITRAYRTQRRNARHRGIAFEFNLPQWWAVWRESGKWEQRGRERGQYVMARIGDSGSYAPGNVEIIECGQNSKDSYLVHPADARTAKRQITLANKREAAHA